MRRIYGCRHSCCQACDARPSLQILQAVHSSLERVAMQDLACHEFSDTCAGVLYFHTIACSEQYAVMRKF